MLEFLNVFFFVFHGGLSIFNAIGWIWRSTRLWHLISVSLTALSWFLLGIWYGWGYCPLTDWHLQIRQVLGHTDPASNYIGLLILKLTGISLSTQVIEPAVAAILLISLVISIVLNLRDRWRQKG